MGIDIEGNMLVGGKLSDITDIQSLLSDYHESVSEWCEEHGMRCMSPWYDSDLDQWTIGFKIDDIKISDMDDAWRAKIQTLADKYKKLTNQEAKLIGMQNVW